MSTKEKIITYIMQFETDTAIGLPVDRSKRALLRRVAHLSDYLQAYAELISEGEIHESGTGKPGDPTIVVLGPAPSKPVELPVPWSHVKLGTLTDFMLRMQDEYEAKGWDAAVDYEAEIRKALESYQPGRPY